jgi:hypothetical protein
MVSLAGIARWRRDRRVGGAEGARLLRLAPSSVETEGDEAPR